MPSAAKREVGVSCRAGAQRGTDPLPIMKNDVPSPLQLSLALQRQAYLAHPVPSLAERKADLRTLQRFVRENEAALHP